MPLVQLLLPSVLLISQISTQEPASLARTYTANESGAYAFSISGDVPEGAFQATAKVTYKIKKVLPGGKAEAVLDLADVKAVIGDNELPVNAGPLETTLDSFGLPQTFPHENAETLYSLLAYCSIAPSKALKLGESLDLDWKNEAKSASIKGKVKLLELAEVDGLKAAKMSIEVEAQSDTEDKPLSLRITSWIEVSNGRLIKAEGKGMMDDVTLKIDVKRGKE